MKKLDHKPEGIEPFDYDNESHVAAINKFVMEAENVIYGINAMLGSKLKRSDGIRMAHDIIVVQSLIHPDKRSVYLSTGPSFGGLEGPQDSREIAGVLNGVLWFESDGKYYSADAELDRHMRLAKELAEPMRQILQALNEGLDPIKDALENIRKEIERKKEEGEEWKGE